MLPFLAKAPPVAATTTYKKKEGGFSSEPQNSNDALSACASDIISAISNKDSAQLARALQAAYDVCQSAESPIGGDPDGFRARNVAAAQEAKE